MNPPDPAKVLKAILADPEFEVDWREALSRWIGRQWALLSEWLGQLSGVERGLILALCLIILGAVAWSVVQGFREGAVLQRGAGTAPPKEAPAASASLKLAERARALAAQGRLREAARMLQQAVYRALADRDGLDWDGARADWEWVARLRGESGLDDFTMQAQVAAYGGSEPVSGGFESLWSRAQQWVAA